MSGTLYGISVGTGDPELITVKGLKILQNSIEPSDVKLIGFAGRTISSFEYRLAILLGAKVGLLSESGGEAEYILKDTEWFYDLLPDKKGLQLSKVHSLDDTEKSVMDFLAG